MLKSTRSRNGFTLIELLVVVSIIALLVSILLPALGRAREGAKKAVCLSNMHQWAVAVVSYSLENDDRFPGRYWTENGRTDEHHNNLMYYYVEYRMNLLDIFLRPYITDYQITRCPGHKQELEDWDTQLEMSKDAYGEARVYGHYGLYVGYKEDLGGINWGKLDGDGSEFVPPNRLTKTSPGMAVAGCLIRDNWVYEGRWVYYHPSKEYVLEEPIGAPAAFADGHAAWADFSDMVVFQEYGISPYTRNWWPNPRAAH